MTDPTAAEYERRIAELESTVQAWETWWQGGVDRLNRKDRETPGPASGGNSRDPLSTHRDGSTSQSYLDAPLPDGAMETHRVTVRAYLTDAGDNSYVVHARGNAPASSYLGLLVMAQRDILGWGSES